MLCCYYPTTTIAIDDNIDFLRVITQHLGIADCISYSSPCKAVESLKNQKIFDRIYSRTSSKTSTYYNDVNTAENYELHVNMHKLHEEIYSEDRFHDASVLIIDYHMDEMSGIEVCEALSKHPSKKILLTGSAEKEKVAIEAFNKGIIHRYINKSDPNFPIQLKQAVLMLKEAYFRDMTSQLLPSISAENISLLQNPAYINFTRNLQAQFNTVEHYLLDKVGSTLFFDANGNPLWLIIKHETEIDNYLNIANDHDADTSIINGLTNRELIPFFFTEGDFLKSISEWGNHLYTAYSLTGTIGYYYTIIEGHIRNNLNCEHIISYAIHQQIR